MTTSLWITEYRFAGPSDVDTYFLPEIILFQNFGRISLVLPLE